MAGEWIALDLGLPDKPEVQELIDITGEPVEVVVYRLYRLWSWASMHCADGMAKMTPPRLCRVCGGDVSFWRAVESVGWLEIDETVATVAVPGWDRRFSQAAKSRAQQADRSRAFEDRNPGRKRPPDPSDAHAPEGPTPDRRRREEIRGEIPPPPREVSWRELQAAWNAGPGRPWKPAEPPSGLTERLAEPGWGVAALEAIERLRGCRFFKTPPTMLQFVGQGFVAKVLAGTYDEPKAAKPVGRHEDKPPAAGFQGDDAARFEATRRRELAKLKAAEVA
jgi:hypothetical protein